MRARGLKVCLGAVILLSAGLLYAIWVAKTGLGIPCLFHTFTGLKCPSCGVSRMCMSLLRLDFQGAYACNPVLFACILPGGLVGIRMIWRYIRLGTWRLEKWTLWLTVVMISALLIYGFIRNLH